MPVEVICIVNPTGGGGKAAKFIEPLRRELLSVASSSSAELVEFWTTTYGGQGKELGAAAVELFCRRRNSSSSSTQSVLVVVGGDGTLSEVMNGVCSATAFDDSSNNNVDASSATSSMQQNPLTQLPKIIYLAAGTGADFARLGYCCTSVSDVVSAICCAKTAKIDVGRIFFEPERQTRYFMNVASLGLGSSVCQRIERLKLTCAGRCCNGTALFFAASAMELVAMKKRPVWFRHIAAGDKRTSGESSLSAARSLHDGELRGGVRRENNSDAETEAWIETVATSFAFCNGQYFGGGMHVAPAADPQDQMFNVTVWREELCGFLCGFCGLYSGKHQFWKSTGIFEGAAFEITDVDPREERRTAAAAAAACVVDVPTTDPKEKQQQQRLLFELDGECVPYSLPAVVSFAGNVTMLLPTTTTIPATTNGSSSSNSKDSEKEKE